MFFKFLAFFFGNSRIENEVFHISPQEEKARDVLNLTLDALKRDEGSNKKNGRHLPYRDTKKLVTIGYGRNLSANGISEEEALEFLVEDYEEALRGAKSLFPETWDMFTLFQQSALINLTFNMGLKSFKGFERTTLPLIRQGKMEEAVKNLLKSKWARDVRIGRATRVTNLLLNKNTY